ncbi:MAG: pyridoxamine 5'-phosphate oxidase family protein [Chloroflexota bacterium]
MFIKGAPHYFGALTKARNYWAATINPHNTPHTMPVWGVFVEGSLYFDGSPRTRRGRNIAANPAVVVHLESGEDVVVLEGEAHEIVGVERPLAEKLAAAYSAKYADRNYSPGPDTWQTGGLYRLTVHKAFAWTKFPDNTTRWKFD